MDTCEAYLAAMGPASRRAAARLAAAHPYLGAADLLQDALEELVRVWRRYYPEKEPEAICRIGHLAVYRHLSNVRRRARSRGEGESAVVSLEHWGADVDGEDCALVDVLEGGYGQADAGLPFALARAEAGMTGLERDALREVLSPGPATLRAVRRLWRQRLGRDGNWWARGQARAVARGLGVPEAATRAAIRSAAKKVRGELADRGYTQARTSAGGEGAAGTTNNGRNGGGREMADNKGFMPDSTEIGLPEAEKPAVKQAAAKKAGGKAKGAKPKAAAKKAGGKAKGAKPKAAAKKAGGKKPAENGRIYPRPGSMKASAAEAWRKGKTAADAAKDLKGNVITFRSWWGEFHRRLTK